MAKRYGIYVDESGNLVVNPHPNLLIRGRDAHQSVMTAVSPEEASRWERVRERARAFVERERNRDHELTPMEGIIEYNEAVGNDKTAKFLKALQLVEAAAGGLTAKPMGGKPAIRTDGKPIRTVRAGHATTGLNALAALKRGSLRQPSIATFPEGSRWQLGNGTGDPYVTGGDRGGYPDVVFGIPEHVINHADTVYGNSDIGAPTRANFARTAKAVFLRNPGSSEGRAAVDYLKAGSNKAFTDYMRHAFEQSGGSFIPLSSSGHKEILLTTLGKPEHSLPGGGFLEPIVTRDADYGEARVFGDVPLQSLKDGGANKVMFRGVPGTDPKKAAELRTAFEKAGFTVVDGPPEYAADGSKLLIGGKYGLDIRPYVEAFQKIAPMIGHEDAKGGNVRSDAKGGDVSGVPAGSSVPPDYRGPRIIINPSTFHNKKDALCVAFNEGFRLWMEANDFQPRSEPTDRQRRFFSDTAYADDELQLRRTILARIATFDTSVKDPTDDQLTETAQFLDGVLESGWCKNEWEQDSVSRLSQAVKAAIGAEPVEPREEPLEPARAEPLEPAGGEEVQALQAGGSTDDGEEDEFALQNSGRSDLVDPQEEADLKRREAELEAKLGLPAEEPAMQEPSPAAQNPAQEPAADQGAAAVAKPPADAPRAAEPASPPTGRQKLALASPVTEGSRGSITFSGTRRGGIESSIVDSGSSGSIAFGGQRQGGIENTIVGAGSAGSMATPAVDYSAGSIESPVDDPRRREERRKRRDRRRRGML